MLFLKLINFFLQFHLNNVREIILSHNNLKSLNNFQYCYQLEYLDVSYNEITQVGDCTEYLGNVKYINLSHNNVATVVGIEVSIIFNLLIYYFSRNFLD